MARKIVRIACVPMIVRARSNITSPPISAYPSRSQFCSTHVAACVAELLPHALHEFGSRQRRFGQFVVEVQRFPLESTKLMERLYFDPLDVLHRGDKPGNARDVIGIVGQSRNEREAHPHWLARLRQTLGKANGGSQVAPGD